MKITVGMFPDPYFQDRWNRDGNPVLYLEAKSIKTRGVEVLPIQRREILNPASLHEKRLDLLHLHWPASIFDFPNYQFPRFFPQTWFLLFASYQIDSWARRMEKFRFPVIWQVHDLVSHHSFGKGNLALADRQLHARIYKLTSGLVLHELSCRIPLVNLYGPLEKPFAVFQLGDYSEIYGHPISRDQARTRLGLDLNGRILSYVGTVRKNRNPADAIEAFLTLCSSEDRLILAGQGMESYAAPGKYPNIVVLSGFLPRETLRDIFCASDFIINDGKNYLTSAVVRTAISYSVPVIAYPYGATLDMVAGASIFIENVKSGLENALEKALRISEEEHRLLVNAAKHRNEERNWDKSGKACVELYEEVLSPSRT